MYACVCVLWGGVGRRVDIDMKRHCHVCHLYSYRMKRDGLFIREEVESQISQNVVLLFVKRLMDFDNQK